MQRLHKSQEQHRAGEAHDRPANDAGNGRQGGSTANTDPAYQPWTDHEEDDHFRRDCLCPQHADDGRIQPGIVPADHGKGVVQGVTAIDEGGKGNYDPKRRHGPVGPTPVMLAYRRGRKPAKCDISVEQ